MRERGEREADRRAEGMMASVMTRRTGAEKRRRDKAMASRKKMVLMPLTSLPGLSNLLIPIFGLIELSNLISSLIFAKVVVEQIRRRGRCSTTSTLV